MLAMFSVHVAAWGEGKDSLGRSEAGVGKGRSEGGAWDEML